MTWLHITECHDTIWHNTTHHLNIKMTIVCHWHHVYIQLTLSVIDVICMSTVCHWHHLNIKMTTVCHWHHVYVHMSQHVVTSHYTSQHVVTWHDMTLIVTACHDIIWHNTTHHSMSQHHSTHHGMSWHDRTCAGNTVRSLRMCAIPEHLKGVFTTRRYTNPRLAYLTWHYTSQHVVT